MKDNNLWKILYESILFALLLQISRTDFRVKRIPDRLILCLVVMAILRRVFWLELVPGDWLAGSLVVSVPMFLMTLIVPKAFGGGDIKLMAAIGLLCGVRGCLGSFVIGALLAGCYMCICLKIRRYKAGERIALGPFLCVGAMIAFLAGI